MQINVLGPLEVLRQGNVVTPSAPKLRKVFALFALHPNKIVQNEQLIEELWEDNPPASVTTTLQTYVYQLRKLLGLDKSGRAHGLDVAEPTLRTSLGGYVLSFPADALDARRFTTQAEAGGRELEAGNVAEAARTLAQALALWRGPALVDVNPGPVLRTETLRLEELRRTTLEGRIDADLRLGRHLELLGELTGLVAQQPTHEGFAGKLMLALHRSGRRAEALRAYQRMRGALATELGLDPSTELQRLHNAVLNSDNSLELRPAERTVRATGRSAPPCHLPPDAGQLSGRGRELAEIQAGLSGVDHGGPAVVVVTGPPGAGKSALCTHAAHAARADFPDGQLYATVICDEGRPADAGELLGRFLTVLGVREDLIPDCASDRCLMFRSYTADRAILMVLDDVTDPRQVPALLPAGRDCGVLITSRRRLSVPAARRTVELGPLGLDGGLALLTSAVGRHRVLPDLDAARDLVILCDGLPAALQACANKLRVRPHWKIGRAIRWINDERGREPLAGTDPLNLRASIERTYSSIPPEVQQVFRLITTSETGSLTAPVAAELLGVTAYQAEALLEDLVEAQLIQPDTVDPGGPDTGDTDGYHYRCLRSIRAASRHLAASPA